MALFPYILLFRVAVILQSDANVKNVSKESLIKK